MYWIKKSIFPITKSSPSACMELVRFSTSNKVKNFSHSFFYSQVYTIPKFQTFKNRFGFVCFIKSLGYAFFLLLLIKVLMNTELFCNNQIFLFRSTLAKNPSLCAIFGRASWLCRGPNLRSYWKISLREFKRAHHINSP